MALTLYDYELSGNCYKVRLLLGILGVEHVRVPVDFYPGREHRSEWFLGIDPMGQLPVIDDGGLVLRDAQAILAYLAARHDASGRWFPRDDAALLGEVMQWLAFADGVTATAAAARLHDGFFHECDIDACRAGAHRLFRVLDERLWFSEAERSGWVCGAGHPTIADIACFPYVCLSEEGGIPRQDYPAIRRWLDRVRRIPGFVVMPGVFPAGPGPDDAPGGSPGRRPAPAA